MVPDPVSRRRVLGLTGAVLTAGIAGCLTAPSRPSSNQRDDSTPSPEPTETSDTESDPFVDVYRSVIPSVQLVAQSTGGHGSGFVYDGHILTNHHVVGDARTIGLRFHEHEWRSGEVIGRDRFADLAILAVDDRPANADSLPVLEDVPPIGTTVAAVGNPFALDSSLSQGIISGVNRALPGPAGYTIPNVVQTDAIVHPGNSGGPLLDRHGRVVGAVVGGQADGVGFAISAPLIREIAPVLIEEGRYEHSHLGVVITPVTLTIAEANNLPEPRGVYILEVQDGGPVDGDLVGSDGETSIDGIPVPTGGDVIRALAGNSVDTTDELSSILTFETQPGEKTSIELFRDGGRIEQTITPGVRPEP